MKWKALTDAFCNLLYPTHCPFCGRVTEADRPCCSDCRETVQPHPVRLRIPLASGKTLVCYGFYDYDGPVRDAIHRMKFYDRKSVGVQLGQLLAEQPAMATLVGRIDCITPVPISKKRQAERGYNQSQVLAETLAGRFGVDCERLLEKHKHTVPQNNLGREERFRNVQGVYRLLKTGAPAGKRILLLDDVVTTGATLSACAEVLYKGGASQVTAVTFSHGKLS